MAFCVAVENRDFGCRRFGGYDDPCDWWWACWSEHTGRNIQYIILFSIDTKGHVIRGGHNGGYD